jgi:deoxyribose-phosphate aldolase
VLPILDLPAIKMPQKTSKRITVSLPILAKMIDHSLLHPTMTDSIIKDGLLISKNHNVATACIKPYSIPLAKEILKGSDVGICPVIGFPAGNSTTTIKCAEAEEACKAIGQDFKAEVDMVVNVGKVLGGDWDYVQDEIEAINQVVVSYGAILKVIFENDYLSEKEITKLCHICTDLNVAFVKTSTGYGFVKQADGSYNYKGATNEHLKLMRKETGSQIQIKAAGGVRTLDDLLRVRSLGVTRIGATATEAILEEARKRGIGQEEVEVDVKSDGNGQGGY